MDMNIPPRSQLSCNAQCECEYNTTDTKAFHSLRLLSRLWLHDYPRFGEVGLAEPEYSANNSRVTTRVPFFLPPMKRSDSDSVANTGDYRYPVERATNKVALFIPTATSVPTWQSINAPQRGLRRGTTTSPRPGSQKTTFNIKPKEAECGAERLATPKVQGI